MLLSLAIRNLRRNVRRTLLTVTAIALGLAMMVFVTSMQKGTYGSMIKSGVASTTGHVVVEQATYVDNPQATEGVSGAQAIADALGAAIPDATIAQRSLVDGLLSSANGAVGVQLRGVQPSVEPLVDTLPDKLVSGEWLQDDDSRGVILGELLAESLDVDIGDRVVYQGNHNGEDYSELLRVRGTFKTGSADIDGFMGVVPLQTAQKLVGMSDFANQVTVHLPDVAGTEAATIAARTALGTLPEGVVVLPWQESMPNIVASIEADRAGGVLMMVFLGLIVAMGIVNTVLMSVMERVREFGVLMAIGVRNRRIAAMVLLEAGVLGLLAALLGLVGGLLLAAPFIVNGLDMAALAGGSMEMEGVVLDSIIFFSIDTPRLIVLAIVTVVVTVSAALYPAWTVIKLKPLEALNSV